jgi:hypothetical protein
VPHSKRPCWSFEKNLKSIGELMRRKKFDDKKLDKKIIFEDKKLFVYF